MDVKHFLAEPGNHPVSVDDFFGDDKSPNLNTSEYVLICIVYCLNFY